MKPLDCNLRRNVESQKHSSFGYCFQETRILNVAADILTN